MPKPGWIDKLIKEKELKDKNHKLGLESITKNLEENNFGFHELKQLINQIGKELLDAGLLEDTSDEFANSNSKFCIEESECHIFFGYDKGEDFEYDGHSDPVKTRETLGFSFLNTGHEKDHLFLQYGHLYYYNSPDVGRYFLVSHESTSSGVAKEVYIPDITQEIIYEMFYKLVKNKKSSSIDYVFRRQSEKDIRWIIKFTLIGLIGLFFLSMLYKSIIIHI
ncbi:hypothetical protein [Candidatus Thioglobus autotrophicus]|uniref:hypothetical protein n=1 Tax=Candidatus Thioglobus autotrophicus TaxID=1705394 RepID=UPI00299D52E4|nr:hypothetical protein [Candidatus Thioglobus autotrophicus]WPE17811.1 hypothetical protein R5P05_07000 [Candidatus Thioglobus autotrophicus]